jgi:hypothetical protein
VNCRARDRVGATLAPAVAAMNKCEVCHNEYDKAFQVIIDGQTHTFDSFECAIHACAPRCTHCGCRVIGHGVEAGAFFCCAHCARHAGEDRLQDRAGQPV